MQPVVNERTICYTVRVWVGIKRSSGGEWFERDLIQFYPTGWTCWTFLAYCSNDLDEKSLSVNDQKVLDLWDSDITREDGHYVLPIPWKQGYADLPNNKFMAQCRLNSLTKRLERTGITDIYDKTIQKMIDSGYAERVPENQLNLSDGSVWYIPHHPVLKKPGKVRPVFDCSAQYKGVSLNSECL